ncbi:MAG: phosphotriesterase family protein [Fusobacteriaceae bacterium]
MFKGITYMHEHVTIDLSKEKNNKDCRLDLFQETRDEFIALKEKGVVRIVDLTNMGMGRDTEYVKKMEEATGIEIVMSTGYYKEPFFPEEVANLSLQELAKKMIDEIEIGIETSGKKAKFIGEIGTGFTEITSLEEKVFIASAMAHCATGSFISTHTSLGKLGHEQLNLLESYNVKLERVILGHTDLADDLSYIESLLKRGVYIAFDTIGKNSYLPDEKRVAFIKELCEKGFGDKLLLSVDLTRRSHLAKNGGIGYSYLLDNFVPKLVEAGVTKETVRKLLVENPNKILEI